MEREDELKGRNNEKEGGSGDDNDTSHTNLNDPPAKKKRIDEEEEEEEGSLSIGRNITKDKLNVLLGIDNESPMVRLQYLHKICINSCERLTKYVNPLEVQVKSAFHRAFWDLLKTDLEKSPPQYDNAIKIVKDAQEAIVKHLLSPNDSRRRQEVLIRLDYDKLRSQMDENTLNVSSIATFIIDILGSICAPFRDEEIRALRGKMDNLVELLRGIMDIIDRMKDDAHSFYLEVHKKEVMQYARELIRDDLEETIQSTPGTRDKIINWMKEVYESNKKDDDSLDKMNELIRRVAVDGLICLLNKKRNIEVHWKLDEDMINAWNEKRIQLIILSSILYTMNSIIKSTEKEISLKESLVVISNDIDDSNMSTVLERMRLHCEKVLIEEDSLSDDNKNKIGIINELSNSNQPIRSLIVRRFDDYLSTCLYNENEVDHSSIPFVFQPLQQFFHLVYKSLKPYVDNNVIIYRDLYQSAISKSL